MSLSEGNYKNDCINIIMWFYRNRGKHISLSQCERDIGVPRPTISRYIRAYELYGPDDWFIHNIGIGIGYKVYYTGRTGEYIWVEKLS